jgi:hypothetical protein
VDETTTPSQAAYDMIAGRDLITDLKLVLHFHTQCITWDIIDVPMQYQGGLSKQTTHYEDLYNALLPPPPYFREELTIHLARDIVTTHSYYTPLLKIAPKQHSKITNNNEEIYLIKR